MVPQAYAPKRALNCAYPLQGWEIFMKAIGRGRALTLLGGALFGLLIGKAAAAQTPPTQSTASSATNETPDKVEPVTDSFDYSRRDVMIPMRDGVKLHTVILVPKGAKGAGILLTRTPYDANAQTEHGSAHLGPTLSGYDN